MFILIYILHYVLFPSQRLVQLFLREETVRVITAGNAILQKSHMYEVLVDLQRTATAWSEPQQVHSYISRMQGQVYVVILIL